MQGELQEGGAAELALPLGKECLPLGDGLWQDKMHKGRNAQLKDAAEDV